MLQLKTTVKSCTPAELKVVKDGKKATLKGYDVILEDTVLFPEGGGQVNVFQTCHGNKTCFDHVTI